MRIFLLLCTACVLFAQDRYHQPNKNTDVCGRVVLEGPIRPGGGWGPNSTGGNMGAAPGGEIFTTIGVQFYPREARKDVSKFAAVEESGHLVNVADFRGKVVVVGLWSTKCEPSLYLLGELAKLQPRGITGGFEILPVNYDPEGWRIVNNFLKQERMKKLLSGVKIYTPALGAQGVHLFMDIVPSLPTFFILDRDGKLAVYGCGYKDWEVLRCLQAVVNEKPVVTAQ